MTYPNLNFRPDLLKIKTKDAEIKELKFKMKKHDYGIILKSLKINSEFYKKMKNINGKMYSWLFKIFWLARLD